MIFTIVTIILGLIYAGFIVQATGWMTINDMKRKFWDEQAVIGKVLLNAFYLPAWALKLLRIALVAIVK
jgi:hypothetical protein